MCPRRAQRCVVPSGAQLCALRLFWEHIVTVAALSIYVRRLGHAEIRQTTLEITQKQTVTGKVPFFLNPTHQSGENIASFR